MLTYRYIRAQVRVRRLYEQTIARLYGLGYLHFKDHFAFKLNFIENFQNYK